jgi:hypothetical protein
MAGQFDKYVKILGTGSRPDRFKGAVERDPETNKVTNVNPDMVAPMEFNTQENEDAKTMRSTGVTSSTFGDSMAVARQQKSGRSKLAAVEKANTFSRVKKARQKAEGENLATTTMRLNEQTGEAYDTAEVKPTPSGRVMPARQANPKYLAADVKRQNEDLQRFTDADSKRNVGDQDATGEAAFSRAEEAKGSTLRSLNGVTYDMKDYDEYLDTIPANQISKATKPYDISEFEPQAAPASTEAPVTPSPVSGYKPSKSKGDIEAEKTDEMLTRGARLAEKKEKEAEAPRKPKRTPGGTPKYKGPSQIIGSEPITEPDMDVVDEGMPEPLIGKKGGYTGVTTKGYLDPYNEDGTLAESAKEGILSTTMREVPSGRPDKVLGHVPVRSPRELAGYEKPTVNKSGNVVPPMAVDTFGSQPTDRKQAEAENKRLRENRGTPVITTVFDPNKRAARPARGKTPEREAVLGAMRETRAAELADEGKEMTTVQPDVMATAKRLGKTSTYNLDDDYMNSTSFLTHPAVTDATIAHALGVHHTLGTENDHLAAYLGGKPLEAQSRRAAAFKIVDRHLRKNPEKTPGEFDLLRGMVHAGSSPQQTLRAARSGESNNVVVNGQNVTIAAGSSENRQRIADTTTNITAQAEAAPKIARGATAGTPTAPLAGTNRVAVRRVGQPPEEAQIREFTPEEARNKSKLPKPDDSKGPRLVDLGGLRPGETSPNKVLKEEKDS